MRRLIFLLAISFVISAMMPQQRSLAGPRSSMAIPSRFAGNGSAYSASTPRKVPNSAKSIRRRIAVASLRRWRSLTGSASERFAARKGTQTATAAPSPSAMSAAKISTAGWSSRDGQQRSASIPSTTWTPRTMRGRPDAAYGKASSRCRGTGSQPLTRRLGGNATASYRVGVEPSGALSE